MDLNLFSVHTAIDRKKAKKRRHDGDDRASEDGAPAHPGGSYQGTLSTNGRAVVAEGARVLGWGGVGWGGEWAVVLPGRDGMAMPAPALRRSMSVVALGHTQALS